MLYGERHPVVRADAYAETSEGGAGAWTMGLAFAGFLAILVRMLVAV